MLADHTKEPPHHSDVWEAVLQKLTMQGAKVQLRFYNSHTIQALATYSSCYCP